VQLRIALPPAAHEALAQLSIRERRDARDQAAVLIIDALARRRLVSRDGLQRTREEKRELVAAR